MKKALAGLFILWLLAPVTYAQNCNVTSVGFIPINDLGPLTYNGFQGGLYTDGKNIRPGAHNADGTAIANTIAPLDTSGMPDSTAGKIVMLSIGMSNTNYEYEKFQQLVYNMPNKNPQLEVVQGAQGDRDIDVILDPNHAFWTVIGDTLRNRGLSHDQVQIIWFKQAQIFPSDTGFVSYGSTMFNKFVVAMNLLRGFFPNAQLCYVTSRTYAGYSTPPLINPEPWAHWDGWAYKLLIEEQINGLPALNYQGANPVSPWISWGPYLWADGAIPRSDGLTWDCPDDFDPDGVHPSDPVGRLKIANLLLDFFSNDQTTIPWFYTPNSGPMANYESRSRHFHDLDIDSTRADTLLMRNLGSGDLMVSSTALIGTDPGEFSIISGAAPFSIAPGDSHHIVTQFNPHASGPKYASLEISSNAANNPVFLYGLAGTGANVAPVLSDIPDQTIQEGAAFVDIDLDAFVDDPDHPDDQLTWSYNGNNELTVIISPARIATVTTPGATWVGAETITFTATDPLGAAGSDPATFTVNPNSAPILSDIPDQTIQEGAAFVDIDLDAFVDDPDHPDDQLTWSYNGNNELTVIISPARIATVTTPGATWVGAETITFTATDPLGAAGSDPATFTVNPNSAPILSDIPDQTIQEGAAFVDIDLDAFVDDPDHPDDQLIWTYSGNSELTVTISLARIATIAAPAATWNGAETISFTATDPLGAAGSDSATFTVTPVNSAPSISNIPDQTIAEGMLFTAINLDALVNDPDNPDDQLAWSFSGNSELTVAINGNRVATIAAPDINWFGSESILFTVTDPDGLSANDSARFTVTPVNDPPTISNLPPEVLFDANSSASLNIWDYVDDIETADIDLMYVFTPGNDSVLYSYDQQIGVLQLTAQTAYAGTSSFRITVIDDSNATASDSFRVVVSRIVGLTGGAEDALPTTLFLAQNYPNPFNPTTTIRFGLPAAAIVKLQVFNSLGQHVTTLAEGSRSAGYHAITFNAANLPAGAYLYRLQTGENQLVKKLILAK